MWKDDDAFMQLPHVDYDKVKKFKQKSKGLTFENYCRMSSEARKAIGMYETSKEFEDSEKAIPCFPLIDVEVSQFVDGEQEIAVGDIVTIKIQITHVNLIDKQSLGYVHSNKFPFLKHSSWYLVFTDDDENDIKGMDKLIIKERVHIKEIKERMTQPGTISLSIHLRNDSYVGFNKKLDVKFRVLPEVKRAAVEYDEEDMQAAKSPSLMQSMMEVNPDGDSDEEESDDETTKPSIEKETKNDK